MSVVSTLWGWGTTEPVVSAGRKTVVSTVEIGAETSAIPRRGFAKECSFVWVFLMLAVRLLSFHISGLSLPFPDTQHCFSSREERGSFCQQSDPGVVLTANYWESSQEGLVYQSSFLQRFPTSEWRVILFTCVVSTIYSREARNGLAGELTQSFNAMYDFSPTSNVINTICDIRFNYKHN